MRSTHLLHLPVLIAAAFLRGCATASRATPETEAVSAWYTRDRYYWRGPAVLREEYDELRKHLPRRQAAAMARMERHLIPMDCVAGRKSPRLSYILAQGEMTDDVLNAYLAVETLEFLDLYFCHLDETRLRTLGKSQIRSVSLPDRGLSDQVIGRLLADRKWLVDLRHVEIAAENPAVTPHVLEAIRTREKLRSVQLSGSRVDDVWAKKLAQCHQLVGVRLDSTNVTDAGLGDLCEAGRLTHLALHGCDKITVDGIRRLRQLRQLQELHLVNMALTDEWIAAIAEHGSIEKLVLWGNAVSSSMIENLEKMQGLRILVILPLQRKGAGQAAEAWQGRDPAHRRTYRSPDLYLGGWIGGLEGQWVVVRGLNPEIVW